MWCERAGLCRATSAIFFLSEGNSSQVKSTTWKTSAVKGPLPKMTVYHEYTGSKTCCVTAPHGVFEPMDRDPSTR